MTGEPGPVFIIGAGPGVGASTARRFGREGHPVGLVARNSERLERLSEELRADGLQVATAPADATEAQDIASALAALNHQLGAPEVVSFSPHPDVDLIKPVLETSPDELGAAMALNVLGAAATAQSVLPAMVEAGRSTLLFVTGSAVVNPSPDRAVSAVTGFAQKSYIELLASAVADRDVYVGHLVVVGAIGPGQKHEPDTVAEHLLRLHRERTEHFTVLR